MPRGKRFRAALEQVDRNHHYEPAEAVALLKRLSTAKFDETVECHIRLGVNVRHADEQLRGTLALPHGTGGDVTVAVFAEGDKAREASEAGADFVGSDDLAERVEAGWTDFDVAIATPDQMPKVGRLGRVLGPQGLMPNPKVGTVTEDVAKAVSESKSGKVEYRTDRQAVVHLSIGKASFDQQALLENYATVIDEIVKAKPPGAKGRYLISVTLTSTMGPGVKIDTSHTTAGDVLAAAAAAGSAPAHEVAAGNGHGEAAAEAQDAPAVDTEREQELEQISAADSPFEMEDPDAE
jgi:large subunit ribosomal protein L1